MKARHWIGILVSAVCLWWALRGTDWGEVGRTLARADPWLLLGAAAGTLVVSVGLRGLRWRLFLPSGAAAPGRELVTATGIGLMANNVLPVRIGEFVRPWVLGRRTGVPVTTAFGSLLVERLFDACVLFGVLLAAALVLELPVWMTRGAWIAAALFAAVLAGSTAFLFAPRPFFRVVHAVGRRVLPERWEHELEGALDRFHAGFVLLRDPRRAAVALAATALLWAANGALYWMGLAALGAGGVGFGGAMFVQSVAAVGVSLPSSPGFVGTFQASVKAALGILAVPEDVAVSYAIAFHVAQYLPVTLAGFVLLARADVGLREIGRSEEQVEAGLEQVGEVVESVVAEGDPAGGHS
ncbi:MAG TPA: lysylphosphatidylglycerol synthase transmembrane domain-containing protein [Gemmatimonadota bacterium]